MAVIWAGDDESGTGGGSAGRRGTAEDVLLAPLGGRPVVAHAVAAFQDSPGVADVLVLTTPALAHPLRAALGKRAPRIIEADGPRPRAVLRAIEAFGVSGGSRPQQRVAGAARETGVLIHDAHYPLVSARVIADCAAALREHEAVCAVVSASDTMVAVTDGVITERPARDRLRRRQYPQGFRREVVRRACELALAGSPSPAGDECGLVLRYLPEVPVALVPGSERDVPVTGPLGLEIAAAVLAAELP